MKSFPLCLHESSSCPNTFLASLLYFFLLRFLFSLILLENHVIQKLLLRFKIQCHICWLWHTALWPWASHFNTMSLHGNQLLPDEVIGTGKSSRLAFSKGISVADLFWCTMEKIQQGMREGLNENAEHSTQCFPIFTRQSGACILWVCTGRHTAVSHRTALSCKIGYLVTSRLVLNAAQNYFQPVSKTQSNHHLTCQL
jgi:hypothetical protein